MICHFKKKIKHKNMTATAALCKAFLSGKIISIKNAYFDYGISNIGREVGRSIERKFHVKISRLPREGKSRYGRNCVWVEYRLNPLLKGNKTGIKKMREYVESQKKSK